MATITLTKCDSCGRDKKSNDGPWIQMGIYTAMDGVTIELGIQQLPEVTETLDVCSSACLHKKVDELLKLPRPGRPKGAKSKKPKTSPETDGAAA